MNRQFLFIKSATESIALPVDSFSHSEYTSDTTISLYFDAKRSGKDASVKVVLTVTSGKAQDVMNLITGHIASSSAAVMKYDVVNSVFFSKNVTGITSITTTEGPSDLVPSGGEEGEVLTKDSATDYDVSWQDVHTLYVEVRNDSGGTLAKGTPVHATGVTGTVADVIAARADTASAMPATYVLNEEIADGAQGRAIISGTITGVDTSSFSPGDVIYVGATGGFTNVKPTGTNLIQNLGVVTKSNANTGSGVVLGAGRANDVPNIPNGQAWIGNASGVPTPTTLATVATTGSYNDLSDQPATPTDTNLGNTDQTLSAERTVEMSSNAIVFDNSSTEVARIFPQGYIRSTGRSIINGNGSIGGQVVLNDSDNSNNVTLQGPSTVSSNLTLTLPDADGSSGEVLKTNGSGVLSFGQAASRGGTYSWSGYATDVNETATFYYQFPSATATSSSTDMISSNVAQGKSQATWGANGAMVLDGLSSTDSATYSVTVKVTTNTTIAIQTLSPAGGQFAPATQFAFSDPSEQTFTLTQTSPTACLSQATNQWQLGLSVTFFAAGSIDFRVEDLSITVS